MNSHVFQQVVDGMDQGIILTEADQTVGFSNAFANALFGEVLTGRPLSVVKSMVSQASDGVPQDGLRGEVLVTNEAQGRQTRCYLNIAPLSRDDADDHSLVWTFFELTEEIANTQAFIDFSAELAALNRDLRKKNEEILRLSRIDELTGAANRRTILEVLEKGIEFGRAHESDVSVSLFDLDAFHTVNDTRGHRVGDELLRRVAQLTVDELGSVGTLGRLSGDTFLIVFPAADREQARSFAEEVRKAIQKGTAAFGLPVTATAGVACHREGGDADTLLTAAYQALMQAKAMGRNRVAVSS